MKAKFAGVLIFAMVLLSVLSDVLNGSAVGEACYLLAGVCAWVATLTLLGIVGSVQRLQAAFIGLVGTVLLILAWRQGVDLQVASIISKNTGLVSMIASVGFLRLIALSENNSSVLPVGSKAYFKTLLGVSVFGTFINLSAPILFADRLFSEARLNKLASSSITRVFSGCSAWSPFFGGMAAVVTYVPGIDLGKVIIVCFPFALVGLLVVFAEGWWFRRRELEYFSGYPVRYSSLWIPAALSVLVVALTTLMPSWSILTCISVSSLALTFFVLVARVGVNGIQSVKNHVFQQLPRMSNELLLFLVAGLLAEGLARFLEGGVVAVLAFDFTALRAIQLVGLIILVGIAGIHPVVIVAGVSPLLLAMDPNPNLLAVSYLLAWSLGTSASPLSGTHLAFQGRYGIASWKGAVWNWPYVLVMYLVAIPFLWLVSRTL